MPTVPPPTWLMVLARGLMLLLLLLLVPPLAIEFLRTLELLVLSLRAFLGRDDGVVVMCSFCWCLKSRSRLAKHLVQSGHSKGFSLV